MTTRVDLIPTPIGIEISETLRNYLNVQFQRLVDGVNFNVVPTGTVQAFTSDTIPQGWFLCDGSFKNKTQYRELFELIGHVYNGGTDPADGTFKLPDGRGRVLVGKSSSVAIFDTLGETGGSRDSTLATHDHTLSSHTHTGPSHDHSFVAQSLTSNNNNASHSHLVLAKVRTTNTAHAHDHDAGEHSVSATGSGTSFGTSNVGTDTQNASHSHGIGSHGHSFAAGGTGATGGPSTANTGSSGSSGTDTNVPPYQVINYIIKY